MVKKRSNKKIKNLKKLRPQQLSGKGREAEDAERRRETGYAGAAKIILKMHCPKKGRNTHVHSHSQRF